ILSNSIGLPNGQKLLSRMFPVCLERSVMPTTNNPLKPGFISSRITEQDCHPLDVIFKPRNVAVIGATETTHSVGRTVLWNLVSNPFGGTVYPVNPKRPSVLGIKAYSNRAAVP